MWYFHYQIESYIIECDCSIIKYESYSIECDSSIIILASTSSETFLETYITWVFAARMH